jgi:hypothetical protein
LHDFPELYKNINIFIIINRWIDEL